MTAFDAQLAISTVRDGFQDVHERIRSLVRELGRDDLNWRPHPEANSIAAMVIHTLGSEREMLAAVRGITISRDRPSEFLAEADTAELEQLVDEANAWLDEQARALSAADLAAERPRGNRPPQPGLVWLVTNYGHAREHLAQIELTKQLAASRR